jgi:acyl-CoA thioesterase
MTSRPDLVELLRQRDPSPMHRLLGIQVIEWGDGTSTLSCTPKADFQNFMGRMHGGFVATLIDAALGSAVLTKIPEGVYVGTVDLNVKFVGKIEVDTGQLKITGKVLHAGRSMLTAEARIEDATGKLYAHGSGTFLVYPNQ